MLTPCLDFKAQKRIYKKIVDLVTQNVSIIFPLKKKRLRIRIVFLIALSYI